MTATFGGEQKFFSNNHSEQKNQEAATSQTGIVYVQDPITSQDSSSTSKMSEMMQQKNKNKMSQMIYGNQQSSGKIKRPKNIQYIES